MTWGTFDFFSVLENNLYTLKIIFPLGCVRMCRIALLGHKWGSLSTILVTSIVTSYADLSHHIEAILLIYSFF